MNSSIADLYATYRRRPTNDLVDLAKKAVNNIFKRLTTCYNFSERSAANLIAGIASKFFYADGRIDNNEYVLLINLFGECMPRSETLEIVKYTGNQYDEGKIKMFLSKDSSLKQSCAELGFAICAIDGQISIKEEDFIDYLLS